MQEGSSSEDCSESDSKSEKDLLLGALEIDDPGERDRWLEERCGGDTELRERVGRLVHAASEQDDFLEPPSERLEDALRESSGVKGLRGRIEIGDQIGDYELVEEIARGAMGVVYRAKQLSLGREVALKMIRGAMLSSDVELHRFQAEAAVVAGLDHPNIVPVYEIGEADGVHFFSMKLYAGGTLTEQAASFKGNPRGAVEMVSAIARAVHCAHQHGVLHRDLKPGNILLDSEGGPHVTDFGLAKQLDAEAMMTLSGQVVGTPYYMSPEQASGESAALTTGADIYSLGAILFECLAGRPPFAGSNLTDTLRKLSEDPIPRLGGAGSPVDRDLETVTRRCLEKSPDDRYASAAALADDLDRWLAGRPVRARPSSPAERIGKWIKRRPLHAALVATASALVLLLAVGGPIVGYRQHQLRVQAEQAELEFHLELARSLERATAGSVPYILDSLRQRVTPEVVAVLEGRLAEAGSPEARARLAAALTIVDGPRWEGLLDELSDLPVDEGPNLALALEERPAEAIEQLRTRFDTSETTVERNRIAVLLLSLGRHEEAAEQLRLGPDLSRRVALIHEFAEWHGDLAPVVTVLERVDNDDFKSGLCLAIGGLARQRLEGAVADRAIGVLGELYAKHPDAGVHAASDWALRHLGEDPPEVEGAGMGEWRINSAGMTMVDIPPGVTFPSDYVDWEEREALPEGALVVSEAFSLSWATVTRSQYLEVLDRASEAGVLPPDQLRDARRGIREDTLPMACVTRFHAAVFCNALSSLEELDPAYELNVDSKEIGWRRDADGYRLPTDAEWELASRAGTETRFLTGPSTDCLPQYAHIYQSSVSVDRGSRPNPFGLFDMIGNAWELVIDHGVERQPGILVNPVGIIGEDGTLRGGPTHGGAYFYHASMRNTANARRVQHAFRVARGAPGVAGDSLSTERLAELFAPALESGSAAAHLRLGTSFEEAEEWGRAAKVWASLVDLRPQAVPTTAIGAVERAGDWASLGQLLYSRGVVADGGAATLGNAALAFYLAGDRERYETAIGELLDLGDELSNLSKLNMAAKALFVSSPSEEWQGRLSWRPLLDDPAANDPDTKNYTSLKVTRALIQLRRGEYAAAIREVDELMQDGRRAERKLAAPAVRALALHAQGDEAAAERVFEAAWASNESHWAARDRRVWNVNLAAEILLREAEALFADVRSATDDQ